MRGAGLVVVDESTQAAGKERFRRWGLCVRWDKTERRLG